MSLLAREHLSGTDQHALPESIVISSPKKNLYKLKSFALKNRNRMRVTSLKSYPNLWIRKTYLSDYKAQLKLLNDKDWERKIKRLKPGGYYDLILKSGELLFCFIFSEAGLASSSYRPARVIDPMKVKEFKASL